MTLTDRICHAVSGFRGELASAQSRLSVVEAERDKLQSNLARIASACGVEVAQAQQDADQQEGGLGGQQE